MQVSDLIRRIDANQSKIQSGRKLSEKERLTSDLYDKIMTTYTSNAIEGNLLTLDETLAVFASRGDGRVWNRDELEALGHFEAHDYMMETARESPLVFSEEIIKKLHHLFYRGIDYDAAGEYRQVEVYITGTEHVPPPPEEVPTLMYEFVGELSQQKSIVHPVLLAAYAHRRLAEIHPFVDGNGRTARLLMNLALVSAGYRVVSIPPIYRHSYYTALQSAQHLPSAGNDQFNELICLYELESQKDYCRMLKIPLKSAPEQER
jgi:Fic family protein